MFYFRLTGWKHLRRDFWGDESIKDLILVSALFWQQLDESTEGAKYASRYKVSSTSRYCILKRTCNQITQYPHIAIIDPRTGAIVWNHDGTYELKVLVEKCKFHPFNLNPAWIHVAF